MGQYSIKDIEALSGIKAHTLRIWEQRYDFLSPRRTDTNIRFYDDEQLKMILSIALLNKNGYRISKIAEMDAAEIRRLVLDLSEADAHNDALFESLLHSMIDFDEMRFEKTLNQAIVRVGFVQAFEQLILPFLERTGLLWCTGIVQPIQEHFMSNLIRRKLSVAIDNQFANRSEHSRRFVLFLPEGEWHELMLLYTDLLLRMHGHEVVYLGCSVPIDDICNLGNTFRPDYLVTFVTAPMKEMDLQVFTDRIAGSYPGIRLVAGGPQFGLNPVTLPANARLVRNSADLLSTISATAPASTFA